MTLNWRQCTSYFLFSIYISLLVFNSRKQDDVSCTVSGQCIHAFQRERATKVLKQTSEGKITYVKINFFNLLHAVEMTHRKNIIRKQIQYPRKSYIIFLVPSLCVSTKTSKFCLGIWNIDCLIIFSEHCRIKCKITQPNPEEKQPK